MTTPKAQQYIQKQNPVTTHPFTWGMEDGVTLSGIHIQKLKWTTLHPHPDQISTIDPEYPRNMDHRLKDRGFGIDQWQPFIRTTHQSIQIIREGDLILTHHNGAREALSPEKFHELYQPIDASGPLAYQDMHGQTHTINADTLIRLHDFLTWHSATRPYPPTPEQAGGSLKPTTGDQVALQALEILLSTPNPIPAFTTNPIPPNTTLVLCESQLWLKRWLEKHKLQTDHYTYAHPHLILALPDGSPILIQAEICVNQTNQKLIQSLSQQFNLQIIDTNIKPQHP
ncbi:hypothetical protein [Deinococcus misasensis]|uniref:hypothetical protein n=1 Tax=Deinococcus misasensis TaxID=392413 RepID=UPI000550B0CC|nr:hypothetical protein [Deinococcus misasensis]